MKVLSSWWMRRALAIRVAPAAAVFAASTLAQVGWVTRPLLYGFIGIAAVAFAGFVSGYRPGKMTVAVVLSLTAAGKWNGWVDLPVWISFLGAGAILVSSVPVDEAVARLRHMGGFGRGLALTVAGLAVGFNLLSGCMTIVDAYDISDLGKRFTRESGDRTPARVCVDRVRRFWDALGFRVEVIYLEVAEYILAPGVELIQLDTHPAPDCHREGVASA